MKGKHFFFARISVFAALLCLAAALASGARAEHLLRLPSSAETVGAEAFYGDTSLGTVEVPDSVRSIQTKAFAYSSLTQIRLPASVSIADDAFEGCLLRTVYTEENSDTSAWAAAKGYQVRKSSEYTDPYSSRALSWSNTATIKEFSETLDLKADAAVTLEAWKSSSGNSGHVFVYVDDEMQAFAQNGQTIEKTLNLKKGTHTLKITGMYTYRVSLNVSYIPTLVAEVRLLAPGQKQQLKVMPGNLTAKGWKSNQPDILSVDSRGEVTALKTGIALVSCTVGKTSYSIEIYVGSLRPNKLSLAAGATREIGFIPSFAEITPQECGWRTSDPAVFTVSPEGIVTAVGTGEGTLSCVLPDGGGTLTAAVSVSPALSAETAELYTGMEKQLTVVGKAEGSAETWSSSDPAVATVNDSGRVTAVTAGTALITCEVDGLSLTCEVTVLQSPEVSLKDKVTYLRPGDQLTVTVSQDDGEERFGYNCVGTTVLQASWPDPNVRQFELKALAPGYARLTFSIGANRTTFAEFQFVVLPSPEEESFDLPLRSSRQLDLDVGPFQGGKVTWTSGDDTLVSLESVASDDFLESTSSVLVHGLRTGSTTVTARYKDFEWTYQVRVTCILAEAELTLDAETDQALEIIGDYADAAFSVEGPENVASVDASGRIHAIGWGAATVIATVDGARLEAKVTVLPRFDPSVGNTVGVGKTVRQELLGQQYALRSHYWTSSDTSVATVTNIGYVKGIKAGTVTITVNLTPWSTCGLSKSMTLKKEITVVP